ncbi:MAG TPA: hypothetical protein VKG78_05740, partial [Opitutaceae bacterium]|nr:hypothetical protein [Opitutaceae bacterium]
MAGQVPGVGREAPPSGRPRRELVSPARIRLVVAVALAACVAGRAHAQMSADAWSTDPNSTAGSPGRAARARSGPGFPLPAYGAMGSSMAQTGHLADIGWNAEQAAAFVDGMRAAFQGRPFPLDDEARQLIAD